MKEDFVMKRYADKLVLRHPGLVKVICKLTPRSPTVHGRNLDARFNCAYTWLRLQHTVAVETWCI